MLDSRMSLILKSLRFYVAAACILLTCLATVALAKTYDVEATGEYVMGDSDTKIEARRLALEHAKRLASEQIGTYLESETVVRDSRLEKDEIRSYTSAILKTTVLSEGVNLLSDKTTVFTIRIKANVDISVLEKKIKEIKGDAKRKEQLERLQAENIKLLKELEAISAQLRSGKTVEYKKLREQRENIFERLDKNQNSIRVTFEKGTLFTLAQKNQDETGRFRNVIDEAFQFLADSIKVKLGEPRIINNGHNADIVLECEWSAGDLKEFYVKIGEALDIPYYSSKVDDRGRITLFYNFRGGNNRTLSSYLKTKEIRIIMNADAFSSYRSISRSSAYTTIDTRGRTDLTIRGVPLDRLNQISNITAKVLVVNSGY